jgi:serine/threonine protein kinase
MASNIFESELPIDLQRQIDDCCQDFERAWLAGNSPKLEDYVARVSSSGRAKLLCELALLELHYRRDGRGMLTDARLCELHPELMPELAEQLKRLRRESASDAQATAKGRLKPATVKDIEPTIDHDPRSSASRGLHIRCPHCSNPVELLSDTPLESITCRTCGSAFSLVDSEDRTRESPTLKRIGRFELVSRLGIGGFGTVWKARDTELDRTVAVKIPRKGQLGRDEVEQFFREARSSAQLRHPNIVPVHEVGRDADTIFIVSDLIRGVSLSDWLSGAAPSAREIAQLMATIAEALHHAHQKGVIHRDLKPSNILLDDVGQPHIMDFGLAKREIGEITMTVDGHVLGTPAYMSPEQAAGEGHWTDRRTDIYSLGVILFRMLTGELPFRGNAQMQIHQRLTADPPDPRQLNRHLPRDLCTICLKCLERDPNRRFSTAKELADECGRYLRGEPIQSRPISRVERSLRWARRKPAVATAMLLTIFLAVAGPIAAVKFHNQRALLQARFDENTNMIHRFESDLQEANVKANSLREKLDVLEGKANPWEFWLWPPNRDQPPRRNMVAEVFDGSGASLADSLHGGKYAPRETARGYLGLAILAEAVGNTAQASDYYERARDELIKLRQQNADQPILARALADCYMKLARLDHETDRDASLKNLQKAGEIYRELAAEQATDAASQIDWLEAEMTSALRAGSDAGAAHLKTVEEINRTLADKWPTDPGELYRLACYLTQTEPILLPPAAPLPATSPTQAADAKAAPIAE